MPTTALVVLAARTDISVLLTDVNMPGSMDGFETRACGVMAAGRSSRSSLASARADLSSADCPDGGCFLRKPYPAAEIDFGDTLPDRHQGRLPRRRKSSLPRRADELYCSDGMPAIGYEVPNGNPGFDDDDQNFREMR